VCSCQKRRAAFPADADPFFTEIQEVYDAIGESHEGEWPPPLPDEVADDAAEIEATGLFEGIRVRRYVWETTYRAEHPAAVTDGRDPRRPVHVDADVSLFGHERRARVHAHPYADRAGGEALVRFDRGGERPRSRRERVEERVPLRIHLHAAVRRKRVP
jgi:hypothetical protein